MSNTSTHTELPATAGPPGTLPAGAVIPSIHTIRLNQSLDDMVYGSPTTVIVPVAKPPKASFFRAREGEQYSAAFNVLDASKMGGEGMYAVGPGPASLIPDHVRRVQLRLAVTSLNAPYLIPVNLPGPDGRWNAWHQSLARAVELAETRWIRVSADMARGAYQVFEAQSHLGEPRWPTETFDDLLEIAFRDRMITSDDHPLIQQLLGKS